MVTIYLLKTYNGKGATSIIEVDADTAKELISEGVARVAEGRDFLVKPKFRQGKVSARSKAFRRPPKSR